MTPLLACTSAAGITGERSMALPKTLGGRSKTFFGRRRASFEILATWALLKGTKITVRRSETVSAERIQLLRLFNVESPRVARQDRREPTGCQEDCGSARSATQGEAQGAKDSDTFSGSRIIPANMSLAAGTRPCSYEILAPLGAGGMREVWRARDARFGHEVNWQNRIAGRPTRSQGQRILQRATASAP